MQRRYKIMLGAGFAIAAVAAGAGIVSATSDDDATEVPITGEALDRATAAALEVTGGGRVTDTEVGDEEGFYEVEVTLDDGSQVDVHLDEDFRHIGSAPDDEGSDDGDD